MDNKETLHITVEGVAEAIAHATDGMSQSVEAMHRIEEILEHYAAHVIALKDAQLEQCREALSNTRITSTNAMNEIRAAAGAPRSQDDTSQKRAVDYVLELKQQLAAAQEDGKRLDWLENPFNQQWLYGTFVQGGSPRAVRVAIDAARNK